MIGSSLLRSCVPQSDHPCPRRVGYASSHWPDRSSHSLQVGSLLRLECEPDVGQDATPTNPTNKNEPRIQSFATFCSRDVLFPSLFCLFPTRSPSPLKPEFRYFLEVSVHPPIRSRNWRHNATQTRKKRTWLFFFFCWVGQIAPETEGHPSPPIC